MSPRFSPDTVRIAFEAKRQRWYYWAVAVKCLAPQVALPWEPGERWIQESHDSSNPSPMSIPSPMSSRRDSRRSGK